MKTPLTRLRELVNILKNKNGRILRRYDIKSAHFMADYLYMSKGGICHFMMRDPVDRRRLIYLPDTELTDDEILLVVEDLEKVLLYE